MEALIISLAIIGVVLISVYAVRASPAETERDRLLRELSEEIGKEIQKLDSQVASIQKDDKKKDKDKDAK